MTEYEAIVASVRLIERCRHRAARELPSGLVPTMDEVRASWNPPLVGAIRRHILRMLAAGVQFVRMES